MICLIFKNIAPYTCAFGLYLNHENNFLICTKNTDVVDCVTLSLLMIPTIRCKICKLLQKISLVRK